MIGALRFAMLLPDFTFKEVDAMRQSILLNAYRQTRLTGGFPAAPARARRVSRFALASRRKK